MRFLTWVAVIMIAIVSLGYDLTSALADPGAVNPVASPSQKAAEEARRKWANATVKRIHEFLSYPDELKDAGLTAVVVLKLRIDRSGEVQEAETVKSSGFSVVDAAAKAAVFQASPLPKAPEIAGFNYPASVILPIKYIGSPPPNPDAAPR